MPIHVYSIYIYIYIFTHIYNSDYVKNREIEFRNQVVNLCLCCSKTTIGKVGGGLSPSGEIRIAAYRDKEDNPGRQERQLVGIWTSPRGDSNNSRLKGRRRQPRGDNNNKLRNKD